MTLIPTIATELFLDLAALFDARAEEATERWYAVQDETEAAGRLLGRTRAYREAADECRKAAMRLPKP